MVPRGTESVVSALLGAEIVVGYPPATVTDVVCPAGTVTSVNPVASETVVPLPVGIGICCIVIVVNPGTVKTLKLVDIVAGLPSSEPGCSEIEVGFGVATAGAEMVVITPLGKGIAVSWPADNVTVVRPAPGMVNVVINTEWAGGTGNVGIAGPAGAERVVITPLGNGMTVS